MTPPHDVVGPHCGPEGECITCGDVAVDMRVIRVDGRRGLALCADDSGRRETVEIALVDPVEPGDRLLVHAGTAIAEGAEPSNPAAADAGADEGTPRRRRGEFVQAGAEQAAG